MTTKSTVFILLFLLAGCDAATTMCTTCGDTGAQSDGGAWSPDGAAVDGGTADDLGLPTEDGGDIDGGDPAPDAGPPADAGHVGTCPSGQLLALGWCWATFMDSTGTDLTSGDQRCLNSGGRLAEWRTATEERDIVATVLPALGSGGDVGLRRAGTSRAWTWDSDHTVADPSVLSWGVPPMTSHPAAAMNPTTGLVGVFAYSHQALCQTPPL